MIDCTRLYEGAKEKHYIEQYQAFLDKALGYRSVKNCFLVPPNNNVWTGGIYDENGQPVPDTSLHSLLETKRNFNKNDATFVDETVVYFGLMYHLWGHCITDELSRAWFIKYSKDFFEKYQDCRVVCVAKDKAFGGSFKALLSMLGIHADNIDVITTPTKFKEVIIPDRCFTCQIGYYQFTKEYQKLIEEIRACGRKLREEEGVETPKKIYISYSHYAGKGNYGEDKLENYFQSKGFEILYPEDHSFESQLSLMLGAEEIASTIGSCSHNSIFAENNCRLTLIPRADYLGGYQPTLCALWGQDSTFVDAHMSVLAPKDQPWAGPFCFTLSKELLELFGDDPSQFKENKHDFENYLADGFAMNNPAEVQCPAECYKYISRDEIIAKYNSGIYKYAKPIHKAMKKIYHLVKK